MNYVRQRLRNLATVFINKFPAVALPGSPLGTLEQNVVTVLCKMAQHSATLLDGETVCAGRKTLP